jgi:predicted DNA-binding antitoxin AbrB/MazE fold protein
MPVLTLEGVVEHGQLKLTTPVPLPDHTKVSVVISDLQHKTCARLVSPRLAHPEQAAEFRMEVSEDSGDDAV